MNGTLTARLADEETDWHLACGTGKWMRLQPAGNRTDLQMTKLTDEQNGHQNEQQDEQPAEQAGKQTDCQAD